MNFHFHFTRRSFLGAGFTTAFSLPLLHAKKKKAPWLQISLQQYSFNGMFHTKKLDPLNHFKFAVAKTGIKALEYDNGFFKDKGGGAIGIEFEEKNDSVAGVLGTQNLIENTLKKLA